MQVVDNESAVGPLHDLLLREGCRETWVRPLSMAAMASPKLAKTPRPCGAGTGDLYVPLQETTCAGDKFVKFVCLEKNIRNNQKQTIVSQVKCLLLFFYKRQFTTNSQFLCFSETVNSPQRTVSARSCGPAQTDCQVSAWSWRPRLWPRNWSQFTPFSYHFSNQPNFKLGITVEYTIKIN